MKLKDLCDDCKHRPNTNICNECSAYQQQLINHKKEIIMKTIFCKECTYCSKTHLCLETKDLSDKTYYEQTYTYESCADKNKNNNCPDFKKYWNFGDDETENPKVKPSLRRWFQKN